MINTPCLSLPIFYVFLVGEVVILALKAVAMEKFRKSREEIEEEMKLKLIEREKVKIRRGKVIVIKDRCKGCGYCIENCPKGVLVFSEDINSKGYHYPVVKEEPPLKVCINCGFCSMICPDLAIYSVPLEEGE